jgi:D-inositol-3-phosphate glycosyltransferase
VVTLLDLAPWQLPSRFGTTSVARFSHRLHAGLVRDAARVMVASPEVANAARSLLHVRRDRLVVVPLAPRDAFHAAGDDRSRATDAARPDLARLGLPDRYLVYPGRFDVRHDVTTLLRALADLAATPRPAALNPVVPWPPPVLITGASPEDRAAIAQAATAHGVGRLLVYAPQLEAVRLAPLVAAARAVLLPMVTEGTGLAAMEAVAAGTPVVASAVGPLSPIVGGAGILVESGDAEGLSRALTAVWSNDPLHRRLRAEARARAARPRRTWADVAADTRRLYADVAAPPG